MIINLNSNEHIEHNINHTYIKLVDKYNTFLTVERTILLIFLITKNGNQAVGFLNWMHCGDYDCTLSMEDRFVLIPVSIK